MQHLEFMDHELPYKSLRPKERVIHQASRNRLFHLLIHSSIHSRSMGQKNRTRLLREDRPARFASQHFPPEMNHTMIFANL